MDDSTLAELVAEHLYDHQERVDDCVVCQQVMRHMATWFQANLHEDPWSAEYAVRVDGRGYIVIEHRRADCGQTVAEWPEARGMWPLTYQHLLGEAAAHDKEVHRADQS